MAKKLYFKNANPVTVGSLVEAAEIIFAYNYELRSIAKCKRELKIAYDELENPTEEHKKVYEAACLIQDTKRQELRTWYKEKMGDDEHGLYKVLRAHTIVSIWEEDRSYAKLCDAVKSAMEEAFGFDYKAENRVRIASRKVAQSIMGDKKGNALNGQLVKGRSKTELLEVYVAALVEYINASGGLEDLVVYKKDFFTAAFTYAKDSLKVEGYKITEKEAKA